MVSDGYRRSCDGGGRTDKGRGDVWEGRIRVALPNGARRKWSTASLSGETVAEDGCDMHRDQHGGGIKVLLVELRRRSLSSSAVSHVAILLFKTDKCPLFKTSHD